MRFFLSFLTSALCCVPALISRRLDRKRCWWIYACCIALGGVILWSPVPGAAAIYAFLLGVCVVLSFFRSDSPGKYLRVCLCWGSGMSILCGRFLFSAEIIFLSVASVILVSAGFSVISRWLSKWTAEDFLFFAEDNKASPMMLLGFLIAILFVITALSESFPVVCAWLAIAIGIAVVLSVVLWNNMSLAVSHSLESNRHRQSRMEAIDRACIDTDAEIFRQLTECRNHLAQLQLAYSNHDMATVSELLTTDESTHRKSYTSVMLLDAVLRNHAHQMEKRGMRTDFILQFDTIRDYSVSDIGVILDTILDMLSESSGIHHDTVRLRVQKWHSMLILTAGRKSGVQAVPELKRETLRQLADAYQGWFEIAEQGKETRISVVLLDPGSGKASEDS